MIEQQCPWCEAVLRAEASVIAAEDEQECAECLTTWVLEDEAPAELALAA